jgi:hypothetical protein
MMDLIISAEDLRKTMRDKQELNFQGLMSDIRTAATRGDYCLVTAHYGFGRRLLDTDCHEIIARLRKLGYGVVHESVSRKWAAPARLVVAW